MKISILTYHREDNYGAVMQAYATYKAIESLNHIPEFIDLRLDDKNKSILDKIVFFIRSLRFNKFRHKYFKNTTKKTYYTCESLQQNPPESDCYLVGSDQTWNPEIAKRLLPAFFLNFGPNTQKRISYATSIGLNEWTGSDVLSDKKISSLLDRFSKILLRETSAIEICKNIFGHDAEQVIDPVLLFPSYKELTGEIDQSSGEIIVYKLLKTPKFYELGLKFAQYKGIPIRSIGSVRHPKGYKTSYPESVENWVKRFAKAEFVLTDSFHGTVFSLLYHKPFVIYVGNPKRTTRIRTLLTLVGLEKRILTNPTLQDVIRISEEKIDWIEIDNKLNDLRNQSFTLLKDAIEK